MATAGNRRSRASKSSGFETVELAPGLGVLREVSVEIADNDVGADAHVELAYDDDTGRYDVHSITISRRDGAPPMRACSALKFTSLTDAAAAMP